MAIRRQQNWCAKKDDPEWSKGYGKYLSDFLRMKNESCPA